MAYYFKLPPIDELTIQQQEALNEPNYISISGAPGTGKSLVSLWRFLRKLDLEGNVLLLTYTKSLEAYFKGATVNINIKSTEYINRTVKWINSYNKKNYNEIIVDEAQDLSIEIYKKLLNYTKGISYGFDKKQSLYFEPTQVNNLEEELEKLLPNNVKFRLDKNFRNTYEIMKFVKSLLIDYPISINLIEDLKNRNRGQKPQLIIYKDEINEIVDIINTFYSPTHNIAILLPFCVTNSLTDEYTFNYYLSELRKRINYKISHYCEKLQGDLNIENIHLTTYSSSKGLEFDTVIIPKFHNFKLLLERSSVINSNHFYVSFTRAKNNLYLLSNKHLDFINTDTVDIVDNSYDLIF